MQRILLGVLLGLVAAFAGAAVVVASGAIDMSAGGDEDAIDWIGRHLLASSVARRAPDETFPLPDRREAAAMGYEHYRDTCVLCHGAPGVEPAELAEGLSPRAPRLDGERVQSRSDGELFHLIKSGVRMTAMPAFGVNHPDREIWHMVAFVRELDRIGEEQRAELREAVQTHEHGDAHEIEQAQADAHTHEVQAGAGGDETTPHRHENHGSSAPSDEYAGRRRHEH